MKKIIFGLMVTIIAVQSLPAIAIDDVNAALQREEAKHQLKMQKLRMKQEINAAKHPERITSPVKEQNLTLGVVQKEIKVGTAQSDVALALGSPNIVTRDSDGKETWIYDKMASVSSYSDSGFKVGVNGGLGGIVGTGLGGGVLNAGYGSSKGGAQSNSRTLTVVIKFNKANKVESFNYHMSNF